MAFSSGVWIEENDDGGLTIGVTDYDVGAFGGDDWEWSATFDKDNSRILVDNLKKEYGDKMTLKEMLKDKFGEIFSTTDFAYYCNSLNLKYEVRRACV